MKLAVGFFDGVHLGHRRILEGADAALTFSNHPLSVIAPERTPSLIMPLSERLSAIFSILSQKGSDPVSQKGSGPIMPATSMGSGPMADFQVARAIEFTPRIKDLSPRAFIEMLKAEYPDIKGIRCGPNWRFGANGEGDAAYARGLGLTVEEVPFVLYKGEAVSSTRIRKALSEGDVAEAGEMLGRAWEMSGKVFSGKGEGRRLGFPTLNVRPFEKTLPLRNGVYAVDTEWGRAVANWGNAPTLGENAWKERVLEVHLLNMPEIVSVPDTLRVSFVRFLRPERKFPSLDDLVRQIAEDCSEAGI